MPSLADVGGAAAVNWAVRTGRMPWKDNKGPAIERGEPRFNEEDTRALVTYIGKAVGDAEIPDVDPARGDLQRGRELYGQACAACHGMNGAGAALGGQNIAVSLQDVHPQDVAEAIKIGPGQMPVGGGLADYEFGTAASRQEVDDIAAYVESLRTEPYNRGRRPHRRQGAGPRGVRGLGDRARHPGRGRPLDRRARLRPWKRPPSHDRQRPAGERAGGRRPPDRTRTG